MGKISRLIFGIFKSKNTWVDWPALGPAAAVNAPPRGDWTRRQCAAQFLAGKFKIGKSRRYSDEVDDFDLIKLTEKNNYLL